MDKVFASKTEQQELSRLWSSTVPAVHLVTTVSSKNEFAATGLGHLGLDIYIFGPKFAL
jgi:hypothetical protein